MRLRVTYIPICKRGLIPPDVYMCPGLSSEGKSGNRDHVCMCPGGPRRRRRHCLTPARCMMSPPRGRRRRNREQNMYAPMVPKILYPVQSKFLGCVFPCFMLIFQALCPTPCDGFHLQNVAGFPGRRTKKYEQHNITII